MAYSKISASHLFLRGSPPALKKIQLLIVKEYETQRRALNQVYTRVLSPGAGQNLTSGRCTGDEEDTGSLSCPALFSAQNEHPVLASSPLVLRYLRGCGIWWFRDMAPLCINFCWQQALKEEQLTQHLSEGSSSPDSRLVQQQSGFAPPGRRPAARSQPCRSVEIH